MMNTLIPVGALGVIGRGGLRAREYRPGRYFAQNAGFPTQALHLAGDIFDIDFLTFVSPQLTRALRLGFAYQEVSNRNVQGGQGQRFML